MVRLLTVTHEGRIVGVSTEVTDLIQNTQGFLGRVGRVLLHLPALPLPQPQVDGPVAVELRNFNLTLDIGDHKNVKITAWDSAYFKDDAVIITNLAFIGLDQSNPNAPVTTKSLDVTDPEDLKKKVPDVQVHGNQNFWLCIGKASSKEQGWMKSTKVHEIEGLGCLVQCSTQQGDNVAEALTFVPGAYVGLDEKENYVLLKG